MCTTCLQALQAEGYPLLSSTDARNKRVPKSKQPAAACAWLHIRTRTCVAAALISRQQTVVFGWSSQGASAQRPHLGLLLIFLRKNLYCVVVSKHMPLDWLKLDCTNTGVQQADISSIYLHILSIADRVFFDIVWKGQWLTLTMWPWQAVLAFNCELTHIHCLWCKQTHQLCEHRLRIGNIACMLCMHMWACAWWIAEMTNTSLTLHEKRSSRQLTYDVCDGLTLLGCLVL